MTHKELNWDTLKVFRTVAELGSMSAAAMSTDFFMRMTPFA